MIKVWAFRLATVLVPVVPRRFGCWVAGVLGQLAYYLAPGARRVVEANLATVLGSGAAPPKVRWLARRVFGNAAKNYFDLFRLPKVDMGDFSRLVQTVGFEHLANALQVGRGVVVVTAHLGNFDVCGQEIAARSLNMVTLVEPLEPPELFDLVKRLRESKGVRFIPVGPTVLKEVVKALKRGDAVGIACDRDIQRSGLIMPFFGRDTSLPQGAAHLALRTGAMVVPAYSERLPDDSFIIHVEPPVDVVRTGDFEADMRMLMAKIVGVMEMHIGSRPDQWVVFERRWPVSH